MQRALHHISCSFVTFWQVLAKRCTKISVSWEMIANLWYVALAEKNCASRASWWIGRVSTNGQTGRLFPRVILMALHRSLFCMDEGTMPYWAKCLLVYHFFLFKMSVMIHVKTLYISRCANITVCKERTMHLIQCRFGNATLNSVHWLPCSIISQQVVSLKWYQWK